MSRGVSLLALMEIRAEAAEIAEGSKFSKGAENCATSFGIAVESDFLWVRGRA